MYTGAIHHNTGNRGSEFQLEVEAVSTTHADATAALLTACAVRADPSSKLTTYKQQRAPTEFTASTMQYTWKFNMKSMTRVTGVSGEVFAAGMKLGDSNITKSTAESMSVNSLI